MTLAEYNQERPTGGWVKITHCPVNAVDAMWVEKESGGIETAYVPVYIDDANGKHGKASLLLQIKDPEYIDLLSQMNAIQDQPDAKTKLLQFITSNQEKVFVERDVDGMIQFGLNTIKGETRQKLAGLDNDLEPNFVVLEEGKHPELGTSLLMLAGGLTLSGVLAFLGMQKLSGGRNRYKMTLP
jgi:hypothetical protein